MKVKQSEILIQAAPDEVWKVITDLEQWHNWNPILYKVSGTAKLGEKITVQIKGKNGKPGTTMKPVISAFEESKNMIWTTTMLGSFLFKNEKILELIVVESGTKLIHKETFSGILPTLTWGTFKNSVEPMLKGANEGLKKAIESKKQ